MKLTWAALLAAAAVTVFVNLALEAPAPVPESNTPSRMHDPDGPLRSHAPVLRERGTKASQAASTLGTPVPETRALQRELVATRSALSRVATELDSLRIDLDRQSQLLTDVAALALGVDDGEESHERPDRLKELLALSSEQRQLEQATALETAWASEDSDERWLERATATIDRAFDHGELANAQLFDLDCRSTLCRVEVGHDDTAAREALLSWLPVLARDDFEELAISDTDDGPGSGSTVVYLVRQGYDLPVPEQWRLE